MLAYNSVIQYQILTVGAEKIFLGANQLSGQTVGAATKTRRRTSGATKTWIPHWHTGTDLTRSKESLQDVIQIIFQ